MMSKPRLPRSGLVVVVMLLAAGAFAGESATIDAKVFSGALERARGMPRLHSLLISQDGDVLVEEYFNGTSPQRTANIKSASKSVLSALVGIAIEQGYIAGPDQSIADFYGDILAENEAGKRGITIGNLLSMQAGLETTSFYNYGAWVLSNDWIGYALHQPLLSEPGTEMRYSTGNTHLLSDILTKATGRTTLDYAREVLGTPLGFRIASWTRDPAGVYFGGNNMELTPRQMLAFGELYLNNGRFNGHQVVPAWWVETSLQPRVRSPRDEDRQYGYGWWIRDMAGVPTIYAWGHGGQFILIVKELGLVAVTTSETDTVDAGQQHLRNLYRMLQKDIVGPAARGLHDTRVPRSLTTD